MKVCYIIDVPEGKYCFDESTQIKCDYCNGAECELVLGIPIYIEATNQVLKCKECLALPVCPEYLCETGAVG